MDVAATLAEAIRDPEAAYRKYHETERRLRFLAGQRERMEQLERECEALTRQLENMDAIEVATSQEVGRLRRRCWFLSRQFE